MCQYLIDIDIQGAAEQCEEDDYVELVKELKLEHTFHALSSLRKILSKLEEGETSSCAGQRLGYGPLVRALPRARALSPVRARSLALIHSLHTRACTRHALACRYRGD